MSSTPATDYRLRREMALLVGAQGGVHACMSGVRLAVPLLTLEQGHGPAVAGALVAVFGLAQMLLSMPAGRMAERHGVKLPVIWGAVLAVFGALIAAAWPAVPGLVLAAVCEGAAIAVVVVAVQRQAGRLARNPDEVRQAFAWASFTPAASNFVGPAFAGVAIDTFGFRVAFLLLALGPMISWVVVRATLELPQPAAPKTQTRSSAWALWHDAPVRRVLMMNWFVSATWEVHGVMVPLIGHARDLSASAIGGILASIAITAALVRLLAPWLGARVREWILITGALLIAAAALTLYPFMHSALAMGACSMLLGMSIGGVQPLVMGLLHQMAPPHQRAQAVALRLILINASSISMPLLAGAAGGLVGVSSVFFVTAALMLAGARMATGLRHMTVPPH